MAPLNAADAARAAAARAAAEAARRAAEEAARRAAAEAARKAAAKAAAEVARKAAAQLAKKPVKLTRDELSTGKGSALRTRGLAASGGNLKPEQVESISKRFSLTELLAAQKSGGIEATSLHNERRGDGSANCLERAANLAQPGDNVVLLTDSRDPVGHAVVERRDGSVVDPNSPEKKYASLQAYQAANPRYGSPVKVSDQALEQVLATPPGQAREQLISELGLEAAASRSVADTAGATTLSPADQAKADAPAVAEVYDAAIAAGQSEAQAAQAAAAELERLAEAHTGDPAYVNTLLREAAPTIDTIATTLGENTEGAYKEGDDKAAIKATIKSLASVAEAGGVVAAATLGRTLASKVDDDSELNQFDDAFYEYKDAGGTNLLFDSTVGAMRAAGKDDAAGELAERGGDGGFVDAVRDGAGNVIGAVGDAFGAVAGFATDLGEGVLHVVGEAGEFAVDVGQGTVNLIGDAANWTQDQVGNAVQYAVAQGLKLAGPVVEKVRALAKEGIDKGLGITENVNSLQPGDKLTIGGDVHAQLGVAVEASAEIEVGLETDPVTGQPVYTVSGQVEAGVGIGAGGTATAGVGGKMEFTFDNPEDAARAAKILAAGAAGVAALASGPGAILAPALLPSPDDLAFLQGGLKSIEVSASVGAEFASAGGMADAEIEGESAYRLNFEGGKPVSMTRITSVSAEGSVGGPLDLVKDSLGNALQIPGDAEASGKVTVETTMQIDGAGFTDVASFLASPASAAFVGEAESTIKIEGDFTVGGNAGVHGEIEITDIDASELRIITGRLLNGEVRDAFDGVEVEVSGSGNAFHDRGFDFGFDGTVAGQGVEVNAHNEVREEDQHTEFEVQLG